MTATICPERDQLSGFLMGRLSTDDMDSVAEHLEQCSECEHVTADLESESDLLIDQLARRDDEPEFASEPELQQALSGMQVVAAEAARGNEILTAGTRIGVYEIVDPLGKGGMGTVYRAIHTELDRQVALKLLPTERTSEAAAIARFRREMKAVGRLSHGHLVQAHDAGEVNGVWYLAMELVDGTDLQSAVSGGQRLSVGDACELVRQAAAGLAHAHEQGIIHRDIKPSNLMLTIDGTVKVLDLGLARLTGTTMDAHRTGAGMLLGTIDYMAPEQAGSGLEPDPRTDVYGLGATLFRLLTGQVPYTGPQYDSALKKVAALANDEVPSARTVRDDIPEELSQFISRMLARSPADRPNSAENVVTLLSPFASKCDPRALATELRSQVVARPEVDWTLQSTANNLIAETDVTSTPGGPANRTSGMRPRWIAGTLILVVGLIAGFVAFQDPDETVGPVSDEGARQYPSSETTSASAVTEIDLSIPHLDTDDADSNVLEVASAEGAEPDPETVKQENERVADGRFASLEPVADKPVSADESSQPEVVPLAVLSFDDRSDGLNLGQKMADVVYAGLTTESDFTLLERSDLDEIFEEQKLTLSGAVKAAEVVQVGQLTGARLLVTGSISQIDRTLLIVGKVFSTETGRSLGVSVTGKAADDLVPLMLQVAKKLRDRIRKDSQSLLPKPVAPDARLATLMKTLGHADRPTLWIRITEEHVGDPVIDPAAQTEMIRIAKEAGFKVIDDIEGSRKQADVVIEGEAFSELAVRRGDLLSVRARVEVKAVNRVNAETIAVDRQTRIAVGLAEHVAGKDALQQAGADIAFRFLSRLAETEEK